MRIVLLVSLVMAILFVASVLMKSKSPVPSEGVLEDTTPAPSTPDHGHGPETIWSYVHGRTTPVRQEDITIVVSIGEGNVDEIDWTDFSGHFEGRLVWLNASHPEGRALLSEVGGPISIFVDGEVEAAVVRAMGAIEYPIALAILHATDRMLDHVGGLSRTRMLSLSDAHVTDSGLANLTSRRIRS